MAIYRSIQQSFWTDTKVVDDFSPEDRYFYLYLMTNPHTNLCGCYELSFKSASDETGYTRETIERLIGRMEKIHKVIRYSKSTKEILILKWSEYNWTKSPKFRIPLLKEIEEVKNTEFKAYLMGLYENDDTVSIPYAYGSDTTVAVDIYKSITDIKQEKNIDHIKEIISYLNSKTGKKFTVNNKSTQRLINARLSEGRTVEDFKMVIDKKVKAWKKKPEMNQYLRPETLFAASHFESYLNESDVQPQGKYGSMMQNDINFDELEKKLLT